MADDSTPSPRRSAMALLQRSWRPVVLLLLLAEVVVLSLGTTPSPPPPRPTRSTAASLGLDWDDMRPRWRQRITAVLDQGRVPILDVESCYHDVAFFTPEFGRTMDELAVALIVFSPSKSQHWVEGLTQVLERAGGRVIPAPPAGHHALTRGPEGVAWLERQFQVVLRDHYPLLGEYFVRQYPPNIRQSEDLYENADIRIAMDGPAMNAIFRFSHDSGIPFEIHLEVEDPFLEPLEKMLARYPRAQVIWCHFGRVRYAERGRRYTAAYVRHLLETFPNLFFDVSCSDPESRWPRRNGSRVSRMWDPAGVHLLPDWRQLFIDHPDRFLAALDLGLSTEVGTLRQNTVKLRRLLDELPPDVRSAVAYRNAWRMMFHEDI